jgi:hypothetical protein
LERKPQFFRAFSSELSVGRRVLLELCSNFRIVLLSSQALKGERVLQILFEQFQIGDPEPRAARSQNQYIREDCRSDGQRGEVERNDEGRRPHRGNIWQHRRHCYCPKGQAAPFRHRSFTARSRPALHCDEHVGECDRHDGEPDNRDAVKQGIAVHPQKLGHRHRIDIVPWGIVLCDKVAAWFVAVVSGLPTVALATKDMQKFGRVDCLYLKIASLPLYDAISPKAYIAVVEIWSKPTGCRRGPN